MSLAPAIREAAVAQSELERRRREHPLAYAALWDNPPPQTSQRRSLTLAEGCTALAMLGGNGSGKSEVLGQLSVASSLGREHPDVVRWLARNGLPGSILPPYPGRVLASALTSNDSRRVVREKIRKYLPAGCTWRNENGDGEAEVRLPGGTHGGGVIVFKSNDQGRRAYQGDEFDLIALDEEHDEDVYRECLMRLGRRGWRDGWVLLSMTPLKGLTWVHRDFVDKPHPGNRATWIHGLDNPYADQVRRRQLLAQYGAHEASARERGEFTAMEGRVYPAWQRALHVTPAREIPADWQRVGAIDFGTRNPFCYIAGAIDPADDVLHIVHVYYARERTLSQHAEAIREIHDRHGVPEWIVADPEDRGSRLTLARDYDIATRAAVKDVRPGISAVAERLEPDVEGRPHLVIHDGCVGFGEFVREVEGYVWAPQTGQKDAADAPLKANDHAMDAIRYLCYTLRRDQGAT